MPLDAAHHDGHPLAALRGLLEKINSADAALADVPAPDSEWGEIVRYLDGLAVEATMQLARLRVLSKSPDTPRGQRGAYQPLGPANRTPK